VPVAVPRPVVREVFQDRHIPVPHAVPTMPMMQAPMMQAPMMQAPMMQAPMMQAPMMQAYAQPMTTSMPMTTSAPMTTYGGYGGYTSGYSSNPQATTTYTTGAVGPVVGGSVSTPIA
jgi:hypothetical protein